MHANPANKIGDTMSEESRDSTQQEPRVGVFICDCGSNIAGHLDCGAVTEYAASLPEVALAKENLYTCSESGVLEIQRAIRDHDLNRVVVASCSPRTHQPLFASSCAEAGLNPYLFEMVNIRDQCSWVHMQETDKATEKAKELVRMAVAKSGHLEPQQDIESSLDRRAVVIGGGVAGMSAAEAMAGMGMQVVLVEKTSRLGGLLRSLNQLGPEGIPASQRVEELVRSVEEKDNITVHLESEVTSVGGYIGNYQLTVQPSSGEAEQVTAGCIVVATGAVPWTPQSGQYGYGQDKVVTQIELERLLAEESFTPPDRVVMLQCAGARCEERAYCSRICCLTGVKNAMLIKEMSPETEVHILYRDMQMYGTDKESMLWDARGMGISFHVYDPDQGLDVQSNRIAYHDHLRGEDREIPFDLAVLSTPLVARDNAKKISQMMRVPTDQNSFFLEAHAKLRPLDFAADGIFVCGSARYPATVDEARSQGMGVAARIGTILFKEKLISSAIVAEVDQENCVGCLGCIQACPYQAITYDPQLGVSRVNEILCKGCGNCASSCPSHSIQLRGYKPDQLFAQIRALGEEEEQGL